MIDYAQRPRRNERTPIGYTIALIAIGAILFTLALGRGLDTTFENQDRMNCRSAKASGNEEWLAKCQCYYGGQPISCIQTYDRK